jgi:hypothetical protein
MSTEIKHNLSLHVKFQIRNNVLKTQEELIDRMIRHGFTESLLICRLVAFHSGTTYAEIQWQLSS